MQPLKSRFYQQDLGCDGSLQSCIRTDDLELVGDGTHLTSFEMLGNFSFGRDDYEHSVELWHSIVSDLKIPVSEVRVHPTRKDHQQLWKQRGYPVTLDDRCVWTGIDTDCCTVCLSKIVRCAQCFFVKVPPKPHQCATSWK